MLRKARRDECSGKILAAFRANENKGQPTSIYSDNPDPSETEQHIAVAGLFNMHFFAKHKWKQMKISKRAEEMTTLKVYIQWRETGATISSQKTWMTKYRRNRGRARRRKEEEYKTAKCSGKRRRDALSRKNIGRLCWCTSGTALGSTTGTCSYSWTAPRRRGAWSCGRSLCTVGGNCAAAMPKRPTLCPANRCVLSYRWYLHSTHSSNRLVFMFMFIHFISSNLYRLG